MDHHQRCQDHLFSAYPLRHKEISWLRTPMAGNILISFLKAFMSESLRSKFRLGCSFEGYDGRLDEIFNVPNRQAAEARIMRNLHQFFIMRYTNQELYHLPNSLLGRGGQDQADAERMEEWQINAKSRQQAINLRRHFCIYLDALRIFIQKPAVLTLREHTVRCGHQRSRVSFVVGTCLPPAARWTRQGIIWLSCRGRGGFPHLSINDVFVLMNSVPYSLYICHQCLPSMHTIGNHTVL